MHRQNNIISMFIINIFLARAQTHKKWAPIITTLIYSIKEFLVPPYSARILTEKLGFSFPSFGKVTILPLSKMNSWRLQMWDSTSVGEENKTFFIRVWKSLPNRRFKNLRGSPKGKGQRGQYMLAVETFFIMVWKSLPNRRFKNFEGKP